VIPTSCTFLLQKLTNKDQISLPYLVGLHRGIKYGRFMNPPTRLYLYNKEDGMPFDKNEFFIDAGETFRVIDFLQRNPLTSKEWRTDSQLRAEYRNHFDIFTSN